MKFIFRVVTENRFEIPWTFQIFSGQLSKILSSLNLNQRKFADSQL